jgi:YfiH family protein
MVRFLFTDRHGGVSATPFASLNLGGGVGDDPAAVADNRASVARRVGVPSARLVFMNQGHSATVEIVRGDDRPEDVVDGMVTTEPGLALAVLVADCVPILAHDPDAGVIAAAHAGRRGAAAGIAARMVDVMEANGASRDRIQVVLGPAVCGSCYEVPADMRADVERDLPGSATETSWGTPALDIRAGIRHQLVDSGVQRLETDSRCTMEDPGLFSHRRDGRSGRFAGVIWMPSATD